MGNLMCFECGEENFFELRKVQRQYTGDDYSFEIMVEVPFCKKCGTLLYDQEIENRIAEQANKRIRECRDILSKEDIVEIISKYDASQKFLSRMLGWGEITLTRYVNNNFTPNKINSDKLRRIQDPYVFKRILDEKIEESDGKIKEESAFVRLQDSVIRHIEYLEKSNGKIYQVVNWFLSQSNDENRITHLALQKLLYFSQGWNLALNNKCLFDDDCEAWVHGAVYRNIYDEFKQFKYNPLPYVEKDVDLSPEEVTVLENVKRFYFEVYTPKTLELICHLEEPYKIVRKGHSESNRSGEIINKQLIRDYYFDIARKYNITTESLDNIKLYLNDLLLNRVV